MNASSLRLAIVLFVGIASSTWAADRPDILLIVADDLGFSDLGCYGGEIETPHLDALAEGGLRYAQFSNSGRCWPSRAAIMTGYYALQVNRDRLPGVEGRLGSRPDWALTLPERLGPLGCHSYHSGKWHIDGKLLENGFERGFEVATCERYFNPATNRLDDQPLPQKSPDEGYYATTGIADSAIEFLGEHAREHGEAPFFQYLAFTAPHFPLHALPEDIERYTGRYEAGWDALRQERWAKIQQRPILEGRLSALEPQIGPPYHFPEALELLGPGEVNRELAWETLTEEQKRFQAIKMSLHAAMVDRLDQEIGRVLDELKRLGRFDNTLILFLSDNGASAEIMVRGDGHDPQAAPGSWASYLCLGPGWARAANTPFRRHKTYVHEGGIATPMIAHWPAGIQDPGAWRHSVGNVIDIAPTLLAAAGAVEPLSPPAPDAPAMPGLSLVDTFASDLELSREPLWWYHEGNRALRDGDWKIVAARGEPWELYNLAVDRTETVDLASDQPELLERMAADWEARASEFAELQAGSESD